MAQLDDNGDGILQDDELALTADADVASPPRRWRRWGWRIPALVPRCSPTQ
ncbi:MAG: hypothetical protein R2838_08935 [Caldilineaceae bacterium]